MASSAEPDGGGTRGAGSAFRRRDAATLTSGGGGELTVNRRRAAHPLHQSTALLWLRGSPRQVVSRDVDVLQVADVTALAPLHRRYKLKCALGQGAFSRTYLAEDTCYRPPRSVVVKVMAPTLEAIGVREVERLRDLGTRDMEARMPIVDLKACFYAGRNFCLVFERLYGDLSSRPLSQHAHQRVSELAKIAAQLLTALLYLHERRVIHADLKPENVLYSSEEHASRAVKLIDFGNAVSPDETAAYTADFQIQSLLYRAPEVLAGVSISPAVDIWSLGCILVELMAGRPLFEPDEPANLLAQIVEHLGPLPRQVYGGGRFVAPSLFRDDVPPDSPIVTSHRLSFLAACMSTSDTLLVRFVDDLLAYDPARRPSPRQALLHPFMQRLTPLPHLLAPAAPAAAPTALPPRAKSPAAAPPRKISAAGSGLAAVRAALAAIKPEPLLTDAKAATRPSNASTPPPPVKLSTDAARPPVPRPEPPPARAAPAVRAEQSQLKRPATADAPREHGGSGGVIRLQAKRAAISKLVFTPAPEQLATYDVIMLVGDETFGAAAPPPMTPVTPEREPSPKPEPPSMRSSEPPVREPAGELINEEELDELVLL